MVIEYLMRELNGTGLTIYKNLPQLSDAVCHTLVVNETATAIQNFNPDDHASALDSRPFGDSKSIADFPALAAKKASQLEIVNVTNVKFINGFIGDWDGVEEIQKGLDERNLLVGFYLSKVQRAAIEEIRQMLEPYDMTAGFANHPLLPKSYYFYAPVALVSVTPQDLEGCGLEFVYAEVEILAEGFSVSFLDRDMEDGWFKITQPSLTA